MTSITPSGRQLFIPLNRDPIEDACLLADCLAGSQADLFNHGERILLIADGEQVWINSLARMDELVSKNIVSKHVVNRDGKFEVEYLPFAANDGTLRALLTGRTLAEGGLVWRLPKIPVAPRQLSEQQRDECRQRLRMGESKERISEHYGVEVGEMFSQLHRTG